MTNTCFWCGGSAEERAARHEGPHLTWCPRFRESQRGGPPPRDTLSGKRATLLIVDDVEDLRPK